MVALLLLLIAGATGLNHTTDPALTVIAQRRVLEVETNWSHEGKPDDVAEVLAYNSGYADPITQALLQWEGSAPHWDVLTNPAYTRIGCASDLAADGITTYVACELAWPEAPTVQAPIPTVPPARIPAPASATPMWGIPDAAQGASSATSGAMPPPSYGWMVLLLAAGFGGALVMLLTTRLVFKVKHGRVT